jgi:hypothetical protein
MPLPHGRSVTRGAAPFAIWLLMLVSLVSWRRGVYFSGGLDPVVLSKAAIGIVALTVAIWNFRRREQRLRVGERRLRVGGRTLAFLMIYVSISSLGAIADGNVAASAVLAIRVLLIAVTVVLLVYAFPAGVLARSLLASMALVGLSATLSGLSSIAAEGRIYGVFPPLNPNEISLLCGLPALGLVHELCLSTTKSRLRLPLLIALLGAVWFTGSRTGLFAFAAAVALIVLHGRRIRVRAALVMFSLLPTTFFVVTGTDLVTKILDRGEAAGSDLLTLNARTIAWDAVLNTPADTWQRWVGAGLSVKQVAVEGQYWQAQVLDSSWISALAQTGVVGTLVLALWATTTVVSSFGANGIRSFTTPVLAFILIRSFLENGLVDSNVPFVVFLTVSLLVERVAGNSETVRSVQERVGSGGPGTQVPDSRGLAYQTGYRGR